MTDQSHAQRLAAVLTALGVRSTAHTLSALAHALIDTAESEAISIGAPRPPALLDLTVPAHLAEESAASTWRARRLAQNITELARYAAAGACDPATARIWASAEEQADYLLSTLQRLQPHQPQEQQC